MSVESFRSWRGVREFFTEAIAAVGWQRLLVWSAAGALATAVVTNTFWLLIETVVPPSMAKDLELLPYFVGVFVATVIGQLMGPYAGLRRQLDNLADAYRVWFEAKSPLARLNRILWNMGTEAECASFRNNLSSRASDWVEFTLDDRRTKLLTIVSMNLESTPKLFHVPGVSRKDMAEFGPTPPNDALVSLARGLRDVGWGQFEMRPSWEWLVYSPISIGVAVLLLVVMVVLLSVMPVSSVGTDGLAYFFVTLAVQFPFYLTAIAFFMLLGAGRPSGVVEAAIPTGSRTDNLEQSLVEAHDPFERIRLLLGALPLDDQQGLLEATHYALWKALRPSKARPGTRTPGR